MPGLGLARVALVASALLPRAAAAADDLASLCTWTDARAERAMEVRFPGTATPFAAVDGHGDDRLDAVLGWDDNDVLRFRVRVRSTQVSVGGDVDPMADWLFRLSGDPVAAGEHTTLTSTSDVRIAGWGDGKVRVRPLRSAEARVRVPTAAASLSCAQLSVHRGPHLKDTRRLVDAGLSAAPAVTRIRARGAPLRNQPRGRVIGYVTRSDYAQHAYVVSESDDFVQVAIVHWTGPVWVGWVARRHLAPPSTGEQMSSVFGALGARAPVDVLRCDTDLPLRARAGSYEREVGTVHAGAALALGETEGPWTRVTDLPGSAVRPLEAATLWVPTEATTCAASTWTPPSLSDLLR